jgi:hypothetical protein
MKRATSFVIILMITSAISVIAGESKNTDSLHRSDLKGISLLIWGGDKLIPDISGGGIAGKYWIDPEQALAGGVIFHIGSSVSDRLINKNPPTDSLETSLWGYTLIARYERHFPINQNVSPFIAPGLGYGRLYTLERNKNAEKTKTIEHIAGTLSAGIEYFFTPSFSLVLQTGLTARYSTGSEKTKSLQLNNDEESVKRENSWYFGISTVGLAISFYF